LFEYHEEVKRSLVDKIKKEKDPAKYNAGHAVEISKIQV